MLNRARTVSTLRCVITLSVLLAVTGCLALPHTGGLDGPREVRHSVDGGATNVHEETFRAGEEAVVSVERIDGEGPFELRVYAVDGDHLGESQARGADVAVVRWLPRRTGTVRIEVTNAAATSGVYLLRTN